MTIPKNAKSDKSETRGWWSSPPADWLESDEEILAHWKRTERAKVPLDETHALNALTFGYGARVQYPEFPEWAMLVDQLELDWSAASYSLPWDKARPAVKAGWTAATEQETQEIPEREHSNAKGAAPHDVVPGGRLGGHGGGRT